MHLTTIISLLAVGAAAAPARKSWDLNTKTLMPSGGLAGLPKAPEATNLARRQDEGEETPADPSSPSSSSTSSDGLGLIPGILRRRQEPTPTGEPLLPNAEIEKDPLKAYLETLDGDYDEQKSEEALDRYHHSLDEDESSLTTSTTVAAKTPLPETVDSTVPVEAKNETSSVAPEPTKKAASKDPLTRLNSALPLKRQEFPEKPESPSVKRQLDGLLGIVPDVKEEDVAAPEVSEKNVTTPAVPVVSEEEVAATATNAHNATSSAAGNTTAKASTTASAGYHGLSKHMAKLNKLPIGGLPVKRGIPTKINNEEVKAPEVKPEDIRTPTTGEEHFDAHPVAWTDVEDAADEKTSRPSTAGQRGYKNMSKLDWLGLPFKRQVEDAGKAVPSVDDDALSTPEVKSSDPASDEKELESNTTINDTVSAVNTTGADTGSTVTDGFHQVSKHAGKLPVNVGLPVKRQAPSDASTEADSPIHKHLVPLK